MQKKMYFTDFIKILKDIKYKNWVLSGAEYEDCFILQWSFLEKDVTKNDDKNFYPQFCRKWFVSKYSTVTEVKYSQYAGQTFYFLYK